jgi:hypothetical protein
MKYLFGINKPNEFSITRIKFIISILGSLATLFITEIYSVYNVYPIPIMEFPHSLMMEVTDFPSRHTNKKLFLVFQFFAVQHDLLCKNINGYLFLFTVALYSSCFACFVKI